MPIAPRSAAKDTWSGPYQARISSEPSILKNLRRKLNEIVEMVEIDYTCQVPCLLLQTWSPLVD